MRDSGDERAEKAVQDGRGTSPLHERTNDKHLSQAAPSIPFLLITRDDIAVPVSPPKMMEPSPPVKEERSFPSMFAAPVPAPGERGRRQQAGVVGRLGGTE